MTTKRSYFNKKNTNFKFQWTKGQNLLRKGILHIENNQKAAWHSTPINATDELPYKYAWASHQIRKGLLFGQWGRSFSVPSWMVASAVDNDFSSFHLQHQMCTTPPSLCLHDNLSSPNPSMSLVINLNRPASHFLFISFIMRQFQKLTGKADF